MKTWTLAGMIALAFVSYQIGYGVAHNVVAKECERLNGFYVERRVFECWPKGDNRD